MTDTMSETIFEELLELDTPKNVVVWDDPVNMMNYVVMVFKKVFPSWPLEKCRQKMLEVHNSGKAVVFSGPATEAEVVAQKIRNFNLWVTLED